MGPLQNISFVLHAQFNQFYRVQFMIVKPDSGNAILFRSEARAANTHGQKQRKNDLEKCFRKDWDKTITIKK